MNWLSSIFTSIKNFVMPFESTKEHPKPKQKNVAKLFCKHPHLTFFADPVTEETDGYCVKCGATLNDIAGTTARSN